LTSIALPVSQKVRVSATSLNIITLVNLGLLAACAALVLYYVLSANGLAAGNYRISSLREDLSRATDRQTELTVSAAQLENVDSVNAFASTHQMVVAKDASYLFENGKVALR
jgi:hypothetical protein